MCFWGRFYLLGFLALWPSCRRCPAPPSLKSLSCWRGRGGMRSVKSCAQGDTGVTSRGRSSGARDEPVNAGGDESSESAAVTRLHAGMPSFNLDTHVMGSQLCHQQNSKHCLFFPFNVNVNVRVIRMGYFKSHG